MTDKRKGGGTRSGGKRREGGLRGQRRGGRVQRWVEGEWRKGKRKDCG